MGPILGGIKLDAEVYGSFGGISLISAACLGGCHISWPLLKFAKISTDLLNNFNSMRLSKSQIFSVVKPGIWRAVT